MPERCSAEDFFIPPQDMADVLIMMKETNKGNLDDRFGLPMRRDARCDMKCRKKG